MKIFKYCAAFFFIRFLWSRLNLLNEDPCTDANRNGVCIETDTFTWMCLLLKCYFCFHVFHHLFAFKKKSGIYNYCIISSNCVLFEHAEGNSKIFFILFFSFFFNFSFLKLLLWSICKIMVMEALAVFSFLKKTIKRYYIIAFSSNSKKNSHCFLGSAHLSPCKVTHHCHSLLNLCLAEAGDIAANWRIAHRISSSSMTLSLCALCWLCLW